MDGEGEGWTIHHQEPTSCSFLISLCILVYSWLEVFRLGFHLTACTFSIYSPCYFYFWFHNTVTYSSTFLTKDLIISENISSSVYLKTTLTFTHFTGMLWTFRPVLRVGVLWTLGLNIACQTSHRLEKISQQILNTLTWDAFEALSLLSGCG